VVDAAPFAGVRYDPSIAGDPATTSAPAYDDVERLAYAQHRTASPYTVLELLAGDPAQGYAAAGATLARWRRTGVLRRDPAPAFYRYEEHELRAGAPAVQRGILAAVALEPLDGTGAVLPHEAVDPARVADRVERLATVPLDVAPVMGLYRGSDPDLAALLARAPDRPPVVAVTDAEGVDHRMWALSDPDDVAVVRAGLAAERVVIADGHHRYAAALALAERRRAEGRPDAPWARTLAYLVDAEVNGPRVLPIHRLVEGLAGPPLPLLAGTFASTPGPSDPRALAALVAERADGTVGLVADDGTTALLRARDRRALEAALPADRPAAWRALDAAVVDHLVVPALRPSAVVHRSDLPSAVARVAATRGSALLVLAPPAPGTVLDLAIAGQPMPAKTTSFRPKPRTGLVMRDVDDVAQVSLGGTARGAP
jgi:uncharacterized protein (DUF1015 family)